MLFPQVPVEEWAKRYELEAFEEPCTECGYVQVTTIPWASGKWRGLCSEPCPCGKSNRVSTAVQLGCKDEWKTLFRAVASTIEHCKSEEGEVED